MTFENFIEDYVFKTKGRIELSYGYQTNWIATAYNKQGDRIADSVLEMGDGHSSAEDAIKELIKRLKERS